MLNVIRSKFYVNFTVRVQINQSHLSLDTGHLYYSSSRYPRKSSPHKCSSVGATELVIVMSKVQILPAAV